MQHLRRKLIVAIEADFDEPLRETILGLREQGNSWRTVAGVLGVTHNTLLAWRRMFSLLIAPRCRVYDPSSLPDLPPCEVRARALGYESMADAIIDLRLCQRRTVREAARLLGVSRNSLHRYCPPSISGTRNLEPGTLETWRASIAHARTFRKKPHIWQRYNDSDFGGHNER